MFKVEGFGSVKKEVIYWAITHLDAYANTESIKTLEGIINYGLLNFSACTDRREGLNFLSRNLLEIADIYFFNIEGDGEQVPDLLKEPEALTDKLIAFTLKRIVTSGPCINFVPDDDDDDDDDAKRFYNHCYKYLVFLKQQYK